MTLNQNLLVKDIGHLLQSLIYYYEQDVGGLDSLLEDAIHVKDRLEDLIDELA